MSPTAVYDLGHSRFAEMHRQARRDALASAARQARLQRRPVDPAPGLVRWVQRLGRVSVS